MSLTVKQFRRKINALIDNTVNRELTDKIGRTVSNMVKTRTRKGFGVKENGGRKERLKKLKPVTKRIRRNEKAKGRLSGATTPNRSNLTRSGRMLNNIGYANSKDEVVIAPKGKEQDKARKVSKERPFMNLSKSEVDKICKMVKEEFIKGIKKQGL